MSAVLPFNFTLYGQQVQGITVPIGSSVLFTLLLEDPSTRAAIDLTVMGVSVSSSLSSMDIASNPIQPPLFTKTATPSGSPVNQCTVAWAPTDTVPSGTPLSPGSYLLDVWYQDASGNRLAEMPSSTIQLTASGTLP